MNTPSGPRRIEALSVGDTVISWDPSTRQASHRKISAIRADTREGLARLCAGDLTIEHVTLDHPLFEVRTQRFVQVGDLCVTDELLAWTGEGVRPVAIHSLERRAGTVDVFDLSVDGPEHDFFAEGLLAHNKSPDASVIVDGSTFYSDSSCFARGTQILTPDGLRSIETLRAGDEVVSWDVAAGAPRIRKLSAQREARRDEAITVVAGGQRIAAVTREHPMYEVERRTYVHVGALTLRATLLAYTDGAARPAALTALLRRAQDVDVYDLSVEGSDPNFFADGLLAHNKFPDSSWDANYGDSALVDAAPQDGEVEDGAPPDAAAQDADAPDANDSGS